jgi:hypothetical protein
MYMYKYRILQGIGSAAAVESEFPVDREELVS